MIRNKVYSYQKMKPKGPRRTSDKVIISYEDKEFFDMIAKIYKDEVLSKNLDIIKADQR